MKTTTHNGGSMERVVRRPIRDRILEAYTPGIGYHVLMDAVFPADQYPRAFRFATGGGPPGCVLSFGNALRRLGLWRSLDGNRVEGTANDQAHLPAPASKVERNQNDQ